MLAQIQLQSAVESLIEKQGLPLAILLMGAFASWRAVKWWAPIFREWGNRLVISHEKLVESSIAIGESNAKTLAKIETVQAAQAITLSRIESTHEQLRKTQVEMHKQNRQGHTP
jgi:hypothetical protein